MKQIGQIFPVQPYDFAATCDVIARFPHPTVDVVHPTADGTLAYWRVIRVDGVLALFCVTAGVDEVLTVACAEHTGPFDTDNALKTIERILCADLNLTPFYDFARSEPELWAVVEPIIGIRWLRTETVYEALMMTIIEQQIAWKAAQRAQRWLVEWGGHTLDHAGRAYFAFPTPEQIANATIDDLKPLKITFRRMGVMIDCSQQVVNGTLDLEALRDVPQADAYDALVSVKGIGHWTAAWTLQRMHGAQNTVGHNDVALQAATNRYFYGGEGRIPAEQVSFTFGHYERFGGLAAHHTMLRWVIDQY